MAGLCTSTLCVLLTTVIHEAGRPDLQDWDKISSDDIDGWEPTGPPTPLLDTVSYPVHMKNFNNEQLRQLCREIRSDLIHTVSQTGGHLGASLGVVELTVALHKVHWDVDAPCTDTLSS